MQQFIDLIRDIPDFPKPGIIFKDITPLLADADALAWSIRAMAAPFRKTPPDIVLGIESRGFIFGPAIASILGCGFAPVRKPGKLPYETEHISYELEYRSDTLEIHVDAVSKGSSVLIVDDLLATGGTASATANLIERIGGNVIGYSFLIELGFLNGRKHLGDKLIHALINYE